MQHPNLVKLVGACFEVRALVYEYLPNGSLEDCLKESPEILTWEIRTRIVYEICSALIYLHSKSVIHADLKPANVLLDANFKSKLSDFGLCRFLPEDMASAPFLETSPMGTPGYTDPWFLDRCILRPGSDLYSLGITVLKLLTGMSPIGLGWKIRQTDKDLLWKMIDPTVGNWPFELAKEMVYWSLQCCYHNENSSEVLTGMSTRLLGMLDEIETLQGGRFKPGQTNQYGSRELEPPSHIKDKKKVMGAINTPSSSSSSEPRQTIQYGSRGPEPPSHNEDKKEIMGAANLPSSSSSFSEDGTILIDDPVVPRKGTGFRSLLSKCTELAKRMNAGRGKNFQAYEHYGADGAKMVCFDSTFMFTLDDLMRADGDVICESTYGTVFTATLRDGIEASVKIFRDKITVDQRKFESVANVLGHMSNTNLLALRAYYFKPKGDKVLIFESMPKRSLATFLHARGPDTRIDWATRLDIAIGIARGLDFLHNEMNIIHANLTSTNILLDDDNNAKVSDYELSQIITASAFANVIETCGALSYRAQELCGFFKASTKTDVYSLGMILLELLTGKSPGKLTDGVDLVQWVLSRGGPSSALDRELLNDEGETIDYQVTHTLELALNCVLLRPKVREVVERLEKIKQEMAQRFYNFLFS